MILSEKYSIQFSSLFYSDSEINFTRIDKKHLLITLRIKIGM